MAHPLRGGVAKPRIFPQREDCRVTEQSRCPVTGIGACDIGLFPGIHAVTLGRGHIAVDRHTAYGAVAAARSKGGRQQKNKTGLFRWGMGGGVSRPLFYPVQDARKTLRLGDDCARHQALRRGRGAGRHADSRGPCPAPSHAELLDAGQVPLPVQEIHRSSRRRGRPSRPVRRGTRQLVCGRSAQEVARAPSQGLNVP